MSVAEAKTGRRWHRLLLSGIVVAYIILGVSYSLINPLFESPDEHWHFAFVKHLLDHRELPIQPPDKYGHDVAQEASQPPLYYLIGALETFWIDTTDYKEILRINPSWAYAGSTRHYDNVNRYVHPPEQVFSFSKTALAARLLRWLSICLGVITILSTYAVAREVLPKQRSLALGAAAMVAFTPQFIFVSSSVTNDSAVIALASLSILLLVRSLTRGMNRGRAMTLGLVLGLALLAKLSALMLIPLVVVTLGIQLLWANPQEIRRNSLDTLRFLGLCLLVAGLVAGWWYIRNWWLYGEPTGSAIMQDVFGHRDPKPSLLELIPELPMVQRGFWAAFGWGNILVDEHIYLVLNILLGLAGLGLLGVSIGKAGLLSTLREKTTKAGDKATVICFGVLVLWCLLVFAALLRWLQSNNGSLGRLLLPTLGAVSILTLFGIGRLVPSKVRVYLYGCLGVLFLLFALIVPLRYIAPAYALPETFVQSARPTPKKPLSIVFGDKIELIGYDLDTGSSPTGERKENEETGIPSTTPGAVLQLALYWRPLTTMSEDYMVFIHLVDDSLKAVGQRDTYPGLGKYPTSLWAPGTIVRDVYYLPVTAQGNFPVLASLRVGFYDLRTMKRLPVGQANMPDPNAQELAKVKVVPIGQEAIPDPLAVRFSNGMTLEGFHLSTEPMQAKSEDRTVSSSTGNLASGERRLTITLYWRARQMAGKDYKDYKVFIHLLDSKGDTVAQHDDMPNNGLYPTSAWASGEQIVDKHVIIVPTVLTSGTYQLRVGLYDPTTGDRVDSVEGGLNERSVIIDVPKSMLPGGF